MRGVASICLVLVLAPALVRAAIEVSPCDYTGWAQDTFERRDGVKIVGDANRYAIHLVSEKPHASGQSATYFTLTEPRRVWGFGQNGCRFLNLTVNGIPLAKTVVSDKTFHYGKAGARIRLNFDGAAVDLAAYMKPGSPLLWFTLRPEKEQLRPIEKIELALNCVVSDYRTKAEEIDRYVKTAVRTLGPDKAPQALTAADGFVLFGDRKLDGSGAKKGFGPSYVALPDFAGVRKAAVLADTGPNARLSVELQPDFREFTFAILQSQSALTEAELMKMINGRDR